MKKLPLLLSAVFGFCSVYADPVVLNGYTLKTGDEKSYSGDYEVNGELRPEDGSEIDGSNWRVIKIVAFQKNGISMTLRSGTLVIDNIEDKYNGCYPNNGSSYINFAPGSTAKVTMSYAASDVYTQCFASGRNFRVNDAVLTAEEFAEKVKLEGVDETHTTFSLEPPSATDVIFGQPTAAFANGAATVTASVVAAGDGSAQVYAVWDYADHGPVLSDWGENKVSVGSLAYFQSNGAVLTGLPERETIVFRVFAVTAGGEFASSRTSVFTLDLRVENQSLPNDETTDFVVDNDKVGYEQKNAAVKKLVLKNGSYVFPGNKVISVYDGAWVENAYAQFDNRIDNKSDGVTFAFTNSFVRYRGTNNNDPNPFSTGSGKSGVRVEMVNATASPLGMRWDCMTDGIKIGVNASDCYWLVDGGNVTAGAVITNMYYNKRGFHLGEGTDASRNHAVFSGGAYVRDEITVNNAYNDVGYGTGASNNKLEILGGEGFVTMLYKGYPGSIGRGACSGNEVVVDGKGFAGSAVWHNRADALCVGNSGAFSNRLSVVDGGVASGFCLNLGNNASSNTVVVSGAGSVMRGDDGNSYLAVGTGDSGAHSVSNLLVVENGATVERFAKWSTIVGGHSNNGMTGESLGNGVIVRSGGTFKLPNTLRIGQIKGAGSLTKGNFFHVDGNGSTLQASGKEIDVGWALLGSAAGAEACYNELVATNGGVVTATKCCIGYNVTETTPGACHDNLILATANGKIAVTDYFQIGNKTDASSRDASSAVVVNNKAIAENGGVIEAKTLATISGNGNAIIARNGGVFQFFNAEPGIEPYEAGAVSIDSGVISYRGMSNCNPYLWETSTKAKSWSSLTVSGKNAFRLCGSSTSNQTYEFGDVEPSNPRHFVRLEMVDGTTTWNGNSASDTLTIGATGSMLCSNTTASVKIPCTLNGPLTIVDATLALDAATTVGGAFSLTIGGEMEDGKVVVTSVSDLALAASLPPNWRLRKSFDSDAGKFVYTLRYVESGLIIYIR